MCHFVRFNLNHKCVSLSMLVFLFFMKTHGSMTIIGALDYGKMRSYEYLKEEFFLQFGGFVGWFLEGQRKELNIMKFV